MKLSTLIAWIGNTDLRASRGELHVGAGPIAEAAKAREFDEIHLLSDHKSTESKAFAKWLKEEAGIQAKVWTKRLSGPTRFSEIYEAATEVLDSLFSKAQDRKLTFHISPGTPAMGAVWVLLAKTKFQAELIESSREEGVLTVSLPFEIAADYLPARDLEGDDEIMRLTQGLPPEVPEFGAIIHRCAAMKTVIVQARRVAVEDVPVLIQGESGTGKELFARAIHESSRRAGKPFVEVNCGAIPRELVESEFFGHVKGAFTGASEAKVGYLESAKGGTLFLDEIGELPLDAQVKLLRALQEKKIQRVGASKTYSIDFRVVAATNRTLLDEVAEERFREDLFHRLAVGVLSLPPLRERSGDLNLLVDHFLDRLNADRERNVEWEHKKLSAGARNLLNQHPWPGNIRELSNTLCRAAIWSPGPTIGKEQMRNALFPVKRDIPGYDAVLNRNLGNDLDLSELLAEVARHYLTRAYEEAEGNKSAACQLVGLPNYQTFTNWMKKYGVKE
ncbi:sigma-54 interaction domain-containing protein [Roseiconus lacunae]|uniref:Sigma 54-interacting transcriptional regulator n=1 Tax=Roseiconus lacunae TaxID=2605694 RepID=A0ABT7PPC3_9BACT|nr:sigma 54-interacting transcriptional regulator [Roseiconus lacunae]MDM4018188.1 sigma 54-interacting transcriptional regulator [Roseiconus lacunae]